MPLTPTELRQLEAIAAVLKKRFPNLSAVELMKLSVELLETAQKAVQHE